MKKRVLSLVLALLMIATLLPVAAMADPVYVAEIEGGAQYETLAAAIGTATDGQTVKLLDKITLTSTITIDKSITLDLGGFEIDADKKCRALDITGSNVTITNGGICNGSCSDAYGGAIHVCTSVSTLKLEGIELYGNYSSFESAKVYTPSVMKIESGAKVEATNISIYENICKNADTAKAVPIECSGTMEVSGKSLYYNNWCEDGKTKRDLGPGKNISFLANGFNTDSEIWLYYSDAITSAPAPGEYKEINNVNLTRYVKENTHYQSFHVDNDYTVVSKDGKYYIHQHGQWKYEKGTDDTIVLGKCGICEANGYDAYTIPITLNASNVDYDEAAHGATFNAIQKGTWERIVKDKSGNPIVPTITYYLADGETLTTEANSGAEGDGKAPVNAGSYVAKAVTEVGADGKTATATKAFTIGKKSIDKPTQGTASLIFDGEPKTYIPSNFDSNTMEITGNTGTAANAYTATVTPKANYKWSTEGDCTFDWTIDKATQGNYTLSMTGYSYGDTPNTPAITDVPEGATVTYYYNTESSLDTNKEWKGITGTSLDNGTYYMFAVVSMPNFIDKTVESEAFVIDAATINKPTAGTASLTYTGNLQTYSPAGYDPNTMEINDNTGTNVGNYTAKVTPKANYKWSTEGNCEMKWSIGKADYSGYTKSVSITYDLSKSNTTTVTLPAIPTGASYGEVKPAATLEKGQLTISKDGLTAGKTATYTIPVVPDANHNGYNITVTVTVVDMQAVREGALKEITTYAQGDDCPVIEEIIAKAKKDMQLATLEGEILIIKSIAMEDIAAHLPHHGFYDALVGTPGKGGLLGFFTSIFGAKHIESQSTTTLLEGIFSLVLVFIQPILNLFKK